MTTTVATVIGIISAFGYYFSLKASPFFGGSRNAAARGGMPRRLIEDACANSAARLAGWLVGSQHANLRGAWAADLHGDPERGRLSSDQRLRLAAGFVVAAIRVRLQDASDLAWRPIDRLLASWHASRLAVLTPITVALGLVLSHEGFYGLISNAENLGVIAAAPYAAIKGLRRYRQISTPERPKKKVPAAGDQTHGD